MQEVLSRHEEAGTTDSPEYLAAMQVFYDRHVCRVTPNPPEVLDSFAQLAQDPTVYHTMNGPSEFHVVGSLKDWSVVDRVGDIAVPTLVVAGAHDEAMPSVWEPFVKRNTGCALARLPRRPATCRMSKSLRPSWSASAPSCASTTEPASGTHPVRHPRPR